MDNQTSAVFGTAIFGRTIFGEILSQTGGLSRQVENGFVKENPWTRRAPVTTVWTRRV
jgi:hypothetical protein